MPANVVKTKRDEKAWKRAKGIAKKQYPQLSDKDKSFYKIVMTIYKNMTKSAIYVDHVILRKAITLALTYPEPVDTGREFIKDVYFLLKSHSDTLLQKAAHRLQGRLKFGGMNISIENRKGSVRKGVDKDGHEWKTKMKYPYGYIRWTEGADGDSIDCYVGDDRDSKNVFVIHQCNPYKEGKPYDEDKVMLGFITASAAKKAYQQHYDRKDFFQSMDTYKLGDFAFAVSEGKIGTKKGKITDADFTKSVNIVTMQLSWLSRGKVLGLPSIL